MDVSIVIPTWRGRNLLEAYLPSIISAADQYETSRRAKTEIVVVEDAGDDDTMEWLQSRYPERVRAIAHAQNQGFCAACQTGFVQACFPIILLLNNDVRLEKDCIAPMVEHFTDSGVFAVTGKMLSQKGNVFCNGGKIGEFRRGMWTSYKNYDVNSADATGHSLLSFAAIGAFSAYDREKFLRIGGFDPLTAMYEDIEISYRGWKRGWLVKYEPRSIAYHDASQTMKRRYKRRSLEMLSRRSRLIMHWILLHDPGMFGWHMASIGVRFLTSWIWLDWPFYWALFTGLKNVSAIRTKRRENLQAAKRSDRELLRLLEHFYRTAPIIPRNV
jgi:GT2 family glycosyltransferase